MPRRLPASVDERIAALHASKQTEQQIATALAREGTQITPSGVHRVLARLGRVKPRKAVAGAERAPVANAPAALADVPPTDTAEDIPAQLRRVVASLEGAAKQAEADKDVARLVAAQRAVLQATALLSKATPPPPVDPNDRPDMRAAAERGRQRMHELLDRLLAEVPS